MPYLVTNKKINRILKDIRTNSDNGLLQRHKEYLRELDMLDIFMKSNKIANDKFPIILDDDHEFLDYRIFHFKTVLRGHGLII